MHCDLHLLWSEFILLIRLFFVEESLSMDADYEVFTPPKLGLFLHTV